MMVRRSDQPETWKLITGSGLVLSMRPPRWEELASDQSTFDKGVVEFGAQLPQRVRVETSSCKWYTPQWIPGTAPEDTQETRWDPTTTNRLAEANLSVTAHLDHLSARQWLNQDASLRVVTLYRRSTTPPRPSTGAAGTVSHHSPGQERTQDGESVLRNGNPGHRARSPSDSEAKHPASCWGSHRALDRQPTTGNAPAREFPSMISCASVRCDHNCPGYTNPDRDTSPLQKELANTDSDTDSSS